jgi:hypothetical protein
LKADQDILQGRLDPEGHHHLLTAVAQNPEAVTPQVHHHQAIPPVPQVVQEAVHHGPPQAGPRADAGNLIQ